jgi:hypothetical protein
MISLIFAICRRMCRIKRNPQWTHVFDPSAKYRSSPDPRSFTLPQRAHGTLPLSKTVEGAVMVRLLLYRDAVFSKDGPGPNTSPESLLPIGSFNPRDQISAYVS